jgi:hypothetical protein
MVLHTCAGPIQSLGSSAVGSHILRHKNPVHLLLGPHFGLSTDRRRREQAFPYTFGPLYRDDTYPSGLNFHCVLR